MKHGGLKWWHGLEGAWIFQEGWESGYKPGNSKVRLKREREGNSNEKTRDI